MHLYMMNSALDGSLFQPYVELESRTQTMKILVTGATGTIGSQVAAALLDANAEVRVGLRDPSKGAALQARGAQVVRFDFEDEATFEGAFSGVERVFLLTPFVEEFVPAVERAAQAAKEAGVQFIARLSALGADAEATEGLARQHGQAEVAIKDAGMDWTVIRPTFFQDNVLTYQGAAVAEGSFYGASNGGQTAYVSSRDVAEVAAKVLLEPSSHAGKTYTVTGPQAVSDDELAAALSKTAGRPIAYVDLSGEQLLQGQLDAGTPRWMAEHLVALEGVKAAGWAAEATTTVQDVLGRPAEPIHAFTERYGSRLR